ncbi:MAG: hypothetical protein KA473_04040 [Anaerolineales bacterium]|nr:hypothetical protein [Anaerolineales bacterium]
MDILRLFRQILDDRSSIRLLNIYKGLPITHETKLVAVGNSDIQVPGNRSHIACLYYQGESFLQSSALPNIVRSTVKSLNLAQDYAILTDFEVAGPMIGKREQIRVEPDDTLIASIQFRGSAFEFMGSLADVSVSGVSLLFEDFLFPTRLVQPGTEFQMSLSIPDFVARKMKKIPPRTGSDVRKFPAPVRPYSANGQEGHIVIKAGGRVVSIRPEADSKRYRMSAQVFFKDLSRMVILQYISHRQAEIINDLRILSEDLYNRKDFLR